MQTHAPPMNQKLDETGDVLNKISFSGVHLYTMIFDVCALNHRLDDAIQLLEKMPVRDMGCLNCGELITAKKLFDEMPGRNVVSWMTMISGYLQFGEIEVAERWLF
ncbi:Alpha,alpha-trehalose-phosphate synthase [UDP-forming] 1-like protein [Gossypium australe]|uniref:Alpha,alpha-trehalose-phosphate synthase [UDP-forming] 1-like protein n=1 Tax=Gossypium australe TaxID=47621 RepID=A0A5B6UC05_9ROSI|nr:Alpha,alpha-trehalose-phosphate synthase [UDP-forming] 1-like protein [Gossypium australe]